MTTMKYFMLGFLLLLGTVSAPGQAQDSTGSRQARKERAMDEDGDGIPDKERRYGAGMKRGKDRFIDRDGDGICDGRAGGLGLRARGGRDGQRGAGQGMKRGNQ